MDVPAIGLIIASLLADRQCIPGPQSVFPVRDCGAAVLRFCFDFPILVEEFPAMSRLWLIVLIIATLVAAPAVFAQAQAAPTSPQKPRPPINRGEQDEEEGESAPAHASNVPPAAAVITINGLCNAPKAGTSTPKSACKTVITREEFETLANTLQPGMPGPVRRQLANAYPRYLVMSKEAERRGIEKDPHYLESIKFVKLQLLTQELNRRMQEEAAKVPEQEIEDYYNKNASSFEQASLQRIFVPRAKQTDPNLVAKDPEEQKAKEKEAEDAMTKVAEDLRARAAAGEDFDKLEKDAYEAAGIKANPPSSAIPKIRRSNLPTSQAAVFDLKAGEVSPVINDPGGHYIYKLESKAVPPLDEVKQEIHSTLQTQHMRTAMQKLQDSVSTDLNEAYFGGAPAVPAGMTPPKPGTDQKPAAKADHPE